MSSEEDEQQSVHSSDEDVDEEENPEEEVEAGEDGAGQVQALTERVRATRSRAHTGIHPLFQCAHTHLCTVRTCGL